MRINSVLTHNQQIACRCEDPLHKPTIEKLANMCQLEQKQVVAVHNVTTTYHVPLLLQQQKILETLGGLLDLSSIHRPDALVAKGSQMWKDWTSLAHGQEHNFDTVTIAMVGKYMSQPDAYTSVAKALEHAAMYCRKKLNLVWVDSSHLEDETKQDNAKDYYKAWHDLVDANGILVPGGFGTRGTLGMIKAINMARTKKTPYLGICLGMQLAVIEYAQNVCQIPNCTSEEFDKEGTANHAIVYMPEVDKGKMGGTMRLGKHPCIFQKGTEWSKLRALYGQDKPQIEERHRHRYEVNPELVEQIEKAGLSFVGKDVKGERMEIVEIEDHPWFVGVQFHPEYLSRVLSPSKTFLGFFAAAAGCLEEVTEKMSKD